MKDHINQLIWQKLKEKIIPTKIYMNMLFYRRWISEENSDNIFNLTVVINITDQIYVE